MIANELVHQIQLPALLVALLTGIGLLFAKEKRDVAKWLGRVCLFSTVIFLVTLVAGFQLGAVSAE